MSLAETKEALRKALYAKRREAHAARAEATGPATARLLAEIGPARGRIISGYRPIRTEIDPTPAMAALIASGARLCVPVIEGPGLPLTFREWHPGSEMIAGPFGAAIPAAGDWLTPDTLIAPLIGWDRSGARLGYGGGFYDRTLEGLRAAAPTRAIGFAYAAQELEAVPTEPTDQPLDALITERETIRP